MFMAEEKTSFGSARGRDRDGEGERRITQVHSHERRLPKEGGEKKTIPRQRAKKGNKRVQTCERRNRSPHWEGSSSEGEEEEKREILRKIILHLT